jgi:hypothetical protein
MLGFFSVKEIKCNLFINFFRTGLKLIRIIKSRRMRLAGHVARIRRRGMRIGYWWESQKERQLGKQKRRWVDSIKIDHTEIGWVGMDWFDLAQDRDQ